MHIIERTHDLLYAVDLKAAVAEALEFLDPGNFRAQAEYARFLGVEEDDVDFRDAEVLASFNEFIREFAGDLVSTAVHELSLGLEFSPTGIRIWRSIMVGPEWLEGGCREQPLGVCWSFDEHATECYEGDFADDNREIVVEALVDPADVDWLRTVVLNAVNDEEREVRVHPDAFVFVMGASWVGAVGRSTAEIETGPMPAGADAFASSELRAAAA